jgi:hypothetical protein
MQIAFPKLCMIAEVENPEAVGLEDVLAILGLERL